MLKKRVVGVITVRNGWAVQSVGYRRYLPLGHPEFVAENYDRWGADEILVLCIDRTRGGFGPDFNLLRRLSALGLATPLAYGGGVRTVEDAGAIIQCGAERVCVDAALSKPDVIRGISALVGAQAIIGVLPLSFDGKCLQRLDYVSEKSAPLTVVDLALFSTRVVSEALVIDWRHEGCRQAFDLQLVRRFPTAEVPLIVFGGISQGNQLEELFHDHRVAAVAIGNFLSYREHAIQALKSGSLDSNIRGVHFSSDSR